MRSTGYVAVLDSIAERMADIASERITCASKSGRTSSTTGESRDPTSRRQVHAAGCDPAGTELIAPRATRPELSRAVIAHVSLRLGLVPRGGAVGGHWTCPVAASVPTVASTQRGSWRKGMIARIASQPAIGDSPRHPARMRAIGRAFGSRGSAERPSRTPVPRPAPTASMRFCAPRFRRSVRALGLAIAASGRHSGEIRLAANAVG